MDIEYIQTVCGDVGVVDRDDDGAPLLQLHFTNEFRKIPMEVKERMVRAAVDVLGGYVLPPASAHREAQP